MLQQQTSISDQLETSIVKPMRTNDEFIENCLHGVVSDPNILYI